MTSRTTIGVEEKGNDILYHYCSTEAFHSIISSRSIWLSALALSNDSMEGKMLIDAFTRLAKRDKIDRQSLVLLQDKILAYHKDEGFGFSLSLEGDLLSQWRGYAEDGCGVSIGFSKSYLQKLTKKNSKPGHDLLSLYESV